jgi:hypothetical protein
MNDRLVNFIYLICFIAVSFGALTIGYFLISDNINHCTSNPLKYYADKISISENISYNYISFNIYYDKYDIIPVKSVKIDLTKSSIPISNLK